MLGTGSVTSFIATEVGTSTNIWDVSVTASGSATTPYFTITITGTNGAVVRNLDVVSNDSGKVVRVSIDSTIKRIENIHQTGGSGELWCQLIRPSEEIGETTRGGEIVVHRIEEMSDFRDLTAALTATGSAVNTSLPTINVIEAGRDILGDIHVDAGTVDRIEALRYIIDSAVLSNSPIIDAPGVNVNTIRAVRIEGCIALTDGATTSGGNLGLFETTGPADAGAAGGLFKGILDVDALSGAGTSVDIGGDLDGGIEVRQTAFAGTIRIGRSLGTPTSTSEILFRPEHGLAGQVIVNAGDTDGEWDSGSSIAVDDKAIELFVPNYSNTAASLGGGAVGVPQFLLHSSSCNPVDGGSAVGRGPTYACELEPPCCDVFTTAKIRMKGPVTLVGASPHVTVQRFTGGSWQSVGWTVGTALAGTGEHREVLVTRASGGPYWGSGYFRIEPIADKMTCEGVDGSPDVHEFVYTFTLTDCDQESLLGFFDQNADDTLDEDDLAAWAETPMNLDDNSEVDSGDLYRLFLAVEAFPNSPN